MDEALAKGEASLDQLARGEISKEVAQKNHEAVLDAMTDYASTMEGAASFRQDLADGEAFYAASGDPDDAGANEDIRRLIDEGAQRAQVNREVENAYRASQGKPPLTTPVPQTLAQEAEAQAEAERLAAEKAAWASDPLGLRSAPAAPFSALLRQDVKSAVAKGIASGTARGEQAGQAIGNSFRTGSPVFAAEQEQARAYAALDRAEGKRFGRDTAVAAATQRVAQADAALARAKDSESTAFKPDNDLGLTPPSSDYHYDININSRTDAGSRIYVAQRSIAAHWGTSAADALAYEPTDNGTIRVSNGETTLYAKAKIVRDVIDEHHVKFYTEDPTSTLTALRARVSKDEAKAALLASQTV